MSQHWDLDNGVGGGAGYGYGNGNGNDPWSSPPRDGTRPVDPFAVGDPRDDAADITVGGSPVAGDPFAAPAVGGPTGGFSPTGPGYGATGPGYGDVFTVGDQPGYPGGQAGVTSSGPDLSGPTVGSAFPAVDFPGLSVSGPSAAGSFAPGPSVSGPPMSGTVVGPPVLNPYVGPTVDGGLPLGPTVTGPLVTGPPTGEAPAGYQTGYQDSAYPAAGYAADGGYQPAGGGYQPTDHQNPGYGAGANDYGTYDAYGVQGATGQGAGDGAAGYPAPGGYGQAGGSGHDAANTGGTGESAYQNPFLVDPYPRTGDQQPGGYFARGEAVQPGTSASSGYLDAGYVADGQQASADPYPSAQAQPDVGGNTGFDVTGYDGGYPAAGYATGSGLSRPDGLPVADGFPATGRPSGTAGLSGTAEPSRTTWFSGPADVSGAGGTGGTGGFTAAQTGGLPPGGHRDVGGGYGEPVRPEPARPEPAPYAGPGSLGTGAHSAPPPPPNEGGHPAGRRGPAGMERRTEALRFRIAPPDDLYGPDDAEDERYPADPRAPGGRTGQDGHRGARHAEFDDDDFDHDDYLDDDDDLGRSGRGHHDELDDDLDHDVDPAGDDDRRRGAHPLGGMSRHRGADGGSRRGSALPKLLAMLVVVALVLGGLIFVGGKMIGKIGGPPEIPDYPGPGTGSVTVTVAQGAGAQNIAKVLLDAGVVKSQKAFITAAANNPDSIKIQPGTYTLKKEMSAAGALEALLDPTANKYRLTIPEGRTVEWIITEVSRILGVPKDQYEAIVKDPAGHGLKLPGYWKDPGPSAKNKVEGYLFPTTYNLNPKETPVQTLQHMVDQFVSTATALDLEGRAARLGRTPSEIITIASIVEMEVRLPEERPKVARVVYNRLGDRTGAFRTLGMDATTRYAVDKPTGQLTQSDLANPSPYNTSANNPNGTGLPPGAIANPSKAALDAALGPADGTWLYFVWLPKSGFTEFSTTEDQRIAAENKARAEGAQPGD